MRFGNHDSEDESIDRVSLDLAIATPENILLTYELAGPARRYLAYLLDSLLRAGIAGALIIILLVLTADSSSMLFQGFYLVLIFFCEWCYFIVCEGLFRGKTPGKAALGLRVIHQQGYPITFWGATLRNLMRGVDSFPLLLILPAMQKSSLIWLASIPLYGPGLVSMLLSPRFQRLGDLLAGTVVISEQQSAPPREPIILTKVQPLDRNEINTWKPDHATLAVIDEYLARRHVLPHERGHELCSELALVLGERLEFRGDPYQLRDYPMTFLARVYVTFVRRDDDAVDEWLSRSEEAAGIVPLPAGSGGRQ